MPTTRTLTITIFSIATFSPALVVFAMGIFYDIVIHASKPAYWTIYFRGHYAITRCGFIVVSGYIFFGCPSAIGHIAIC